MKNIYVFQNNIRNAWLCSDINEATQKLEEFVRQDKNWGTYRPNEYKLVTSDIEDFSTAADFMKESSCEDMKLPYRYQVSVNCLNSEEAEEDFFMSDEQRVYEEWKKESQKELEKMSGKKKVKLTNEEKAYMKEYKDQKWYTIWDLEEERDFSQGGHPVVFLSEEEAKEFIKCIEAGKVEQDEKEQLKAKYIENRAFEYDKVKEYNSIMKQFQAEIEQYM